MKHVVYLPSAVRAVFTAMQVRRIIAPLLAALLTLAGAYAETPPETPFPSKPVPAPVTKEQTVYVPFEKLEQVFENEGRGVFLPYREFLEMWNKLKLPEEIKKKEPPVDGVLAAAQYTGRVVEGNVASISAKLDLEALKEGWSMLKLGKGDWNITDVKSTATLNRSADGYEVIFPNKGKYELQMTVFGRIKREAGRSSLHLQLPRTAVSQFELVVPEKGWEFSMTPACAFTTLEQPDGSTKLAVYFGASEEVDIAWQKKAGESALTPLLFAETTSTMKLSAGAFRTTSQVQFRILRAGVSAFELLVPAGQQVLNVDGQNLRDWNIEASGSMQKLTVNLHTPAKESYSLQVTAESAIASLPAKIVATGIEVKNVERQSGLVTIDADSDLVVDAGELQGLTQQSVAAERDSTVVGQYRYLRLPYAAVLSVSEAKPVVEVGSNTLLTVEPETLKLFGAFRYTVKKAGIFSTQIVLPAGFDQAEATAAPGDSPGAIETAMVQTVGAKKVLNVTFASRRIGDFSFQVTAEAPRKSAVDPVTAPAFIPQNVARHTAVVGLAIHVSLKAHTTDFGDMRQQDIRQIADLPVKNAEATPLTLGFRFRGEAKPAQIGFELRKPRVSAEVLTMTEVREALVRHTWLVDYTVEYAGVDEFAVTVPKAIADEIQIDGAAIKERVKVDEKPAPGKPEGRVTWKIKLQDKKLGEYELKITYETPQTQLRQGSAASVALPDIEPIDVFRATGQIAVVKDGNIEFGKTETRGLELMDPAELKPALHQNGVFLAYKYSAQPVVLRLDVAKNLFLEVPQALVTYAVLTSVIAENKAETTEAVYWVRNNSQQFLAVALPSNGRMLSDAFVNGEPQQPSRRPDRNEMLIRLPAQQSGTAFPVRFVYEVPSAKPEGGLWWLGTIRVKPPTLVNTGVLQSKWTLYLPGGCRYVKFSGPMREAPAPWGWDVFRRASDLFVPDLGPRLPEGNAVAFNEPEGLPPGKGGGFDFQIPKEGESVVLRRLDAPAKTIVHYRSRGYAAVIEALALLVAFYFGARLTMRPPATRFGYAMIVGGGSLILAGAVDQRAAGFWTAIYLGVLGAVGVWFAAAVWKRIKGRARIVGAVPAHVPASAPKERGAPTTETVFGEPGSPEAGQPAEGTQSASAAPKAEPEAQPPADQKAPPPDRNRKNKDKGS